MREALGKREAETALWEQYKPLLQLLFIDQDRSLKEVRDVMADHCGFARKPHQYELRFKKWEFRKNFSGREWRTAKSLLDQRKLNGHRSIIMSAGRIVKRAQKRIDRHAYETIYDRFRRSIDTEHVPSDTQRALIARTPSPGLDIRFGYDQVSETLWYSSLKLFDKSFNNTSQNQVGFIPQDPAQLLCEAMLRMSLQSHSRQASGISNFILSRHRLRRRLLGSPCASVINVDDTIALRTGQALMDLLKSAIYLISNNLAGHTGIGLLIVTICQLPTNRNALEHLLKQKHSTIQAFAENFLHDVSVANDPVLVNILLKSGVDPNSKCGVCQNKNRLFCAIHSGSSEAANALLEAGVDEKALDYDGLSCLMKCYRAMLFDLASKLLKRGADISIRVSDPTLPTAISYAAFYGGLPAVSTLASHDPAAFQILLCQDASTNVMLAASLGNDNLVQFLLTRNISLNDWSYGLCGAAANGKSQIVQLLLSRGVKVDGRTTRYFFNAFVPWLKECKDMTALEVALQHGQVAVARLLLEWGADPHIEPSALEDLCYQFLDNEAGEFEEPSDYRPVVLLPKPTTLARLAKSSKLAEFVELVELLLQAGAKPNEAILVWLSLVGAIGLVKYLIEQGMHPNTSAAVCTTGFCKTPRQLSVLAAALYAGNDELVTFLLQRAADVNIPSGFDYDMSPLAASISCGRLEWAKELTDREADSKDPMALWAAAHTDSVEAYDLICSAVAKTHGSSIADFAHLAASEAIYRGDVVFLRKIVANGINLNKPAASGKGSLDIWAYVDPLPCAVFKADIDAVQLLLDNGADPRLRYLDEQLKSGPLPILSVLPHHLYHHSPSALRSIADLLISTGAQVHYSGPTSRHNPLVAVICGSASLPMVDLLIRNGGLVDSISISPSQLTTPLCSAIDIGSYAVVRRLVAENARVFSVVQFDLDMLPMTAIQLAAIRGHLDILDHLLGKIEGDPQFITEYPLALRLACRHSHRTTSQYLQDYRMRTFGHVACERDDEILMNLEDEQTDVKYCYNFWEDERYSGWESCLYQHRYRWRQSKAYAFLGDVLGDVLGDNNDSGLDDQREEYWNSNDDNNESEVVLCIANEDASTLFRDNPTVSEWQEYLNFDNNESHFLLEYDHNDLLIDLDQSHPLPNDNNRQTGAIIEELPEETSTELSVQPLESNVLGQQFTNDDTLEVPQHIDETFDWKSFQIGDTLLTPWDEHGAGSVLTDFDLDLWTT